MATLECCVGGCIATSKTHRLFSFPKNDKLRSLWLCFLVPTNTFLITLSKEQLLRKRVCERHFDRYQFDHEGRRLRLSYPCLFSENEVAHGIPLARGLNVFAEHNYFQKQEEDDDPESSLEVRSGCFTNDHNIYSKEQYENDNMYSKEQYENDNMYSKEHYQNDNMYSKEQYENDVSQHLFVMESESHTDEVLSEAPVEEQFIDENNESDPEIMELFESDPLQDESVEENLHKDLTQWKHILTTGLPKEEKN